MVVLLVVVPVVEVVRVVKVVVRVGVLVPVGGGVVEGCAGVE